MDGGTLRAAVFRAAFADSTGNVKDRMTLEATWSWDKIIPLVSESTEAGYPGKRCGLGQTVSPAAGGSPSFLRGDTTVIQPPSEARSRSPLSSTVLPDQRTRAAIQSGILVQDRTK